MTVPSGSLFGLQASRDNMLVLIHWYNNLEFVSIITNFRGSVNLESYHSLDSPTNSQQVIKSHSSMGSLM
jgi:hypothetical protein